MNLEGHGFVDSSGATAVVSVQSTGTRGHIFVPAAQGILLHTTATRGAGARRTGDFSAETKSRATALTRGVGPQNRLQPFLFEPDFFRGNEPDDHAVSAPLTDGKSRGTSTFR